MTANGNRSRVVVIDPLKLRQAGLVRLLEDWAESKDLEIVATATTEDSTVWSNCRVVVLNLGATSVTDAAPQRWISTVKLFKPDIPIAVLSDREDCPEIRAAFKSGVSGFIPASLEPTLAMEALTFLSRGGSFFPCSVLLEESQAVRETTSRVLRGEPERVLTEQREYAGAKQPELTLIEPLQAAAFQAGMSHGPRQGHGYTEVRRTQVRIAARARMSEPPLSWAGDTEVQKAPALTPRQQEVLQKLSEGKSNKLIARDLDMTEATVKVHVRQIMRKFGATNRTQAALCAMRLTSLAMFRRAR